jgi:hypothetical protein
MIYTSIILIGVVMLTVAILFFVSNNPVGGIAILIMMLIYFLILFCCFRKNLDAAVIIIKVTAHFLTENPIVYVIPIAVGAIVLLFTIFWSVSLIGLSGMSQAGKLTTQSAGFLYFLEGMFYLFFTYFFHYVMVFLVSSCVYNWYYQLGKPGVCVGLGHLVSSHLGSLTFASFLITIIKIAQSVVDSA